MARASSVGATKPRSRASAAAGARSAAPAQPPLRLRVELRHLTPAIWRRLLVPRTITLARLHQVLQIAMGWTNSHLHEFVIGTTRYGLRDADWPDTPAVIPEGRVMLARALEPDVKQFRYLYDFGDNWEHTILVEALHDDDLTAPAPVCIAGANACPPEDVGGPPGYIGFLHAIADPSHEEHADLLEWIGGRFDPYAFDIDGVNEQLARLRR